MIGDTIIPVCASKAHAEKSSGALLYSEDVFAQRRFAIVVAAIAVACVVGGLWLLLGANQLSDGIGLLVAGTLLAGILRLFAVLHVRVQNEGLHARFGPWGLNLPAGQIDSARAETYRWGSYYGWGMRWGRDEGRPGRAMSVPFLRSGVIVETKEGGRHYINSRRPEELAAAVNRIAEDPDEA